MTQAEAVAAGAMALFGEKYGEIVRVISVGEPGCPSESRELCGGTHVRRTGQIGPLTIVSEAGVAAGVRRIEAVTGWEALRLAREQREEAARLAALLKARPGELAARAESLIKEVKSARKELDKAATRAISGQGRDLLEAAVDCNGVRLLVACLDGRPIKSLLKIMDDVRSRLPSGVACLAARENGRIGLVLYVSADLHDRFTAPALIREIAGPIDGAGGGRPDQAQAGGSNPDGYDEAIRLLRARVGAAR
jgi:alanyl-tRNA synthetase